MPYRCNTADELRVEFRLFTGRGRGLWDRPGSGAFRTCKKEDKNGLVFVPLIRIFLSSKQYLEESLIDQNDDYDYSRSYFAVLFR